MNLWFWGILQKLVCILMEVKKFMYLNNEGVPEKLMDIFYTDSCMCDVMFAVVWNVLMVDEEDSVNQPSMN